ncbi:MAG: SpoIID/LytB domain-containing protein [Patescibacteria group bacterium]|nr:SpoIID/LytB domain-containing protein [Patescibacteria group bacterium]
MKIVKNNYRLHFWGLTLILLASFLPSNQTVSAASFDYAAKWVNQLEGMSVKQGETVSMWVDLQNTGSVAWESAGPNAVKVATTRQRDRDSFYHDESWIDINRITSADTVVLPGQTGRFNFVARAGGPAGKYREYFSLVAEGITWFEDFEFYIEINILPLSFSGAVIQQPQALKLKVGETAEIKVKFQNNSEVDWQNTGINAVKIGTVDPFDRTSPLKHISWLSGNRVVITGMPTPIGATAEYNFMIQAPNEIGKYQENFQLVAEGMAWIPGTKFAVNLEVEPAIYELQWVNQSPSPVLTPGGEETVWVELRNTGNVIWKNTRDNAVKLGTSRTLDRQSDFYSPTWLSTNRAAVADKEIAPGETGRFSFTIKAPDNIATYKEYFRLVAENVTWFPDLGIYWEITVNEELVLVNPIEVGLSSTTDFVTIASSGGLVVRKGSNKDLVLRVDNSSPVIVTPKTDGYILSVAGSTYDINDWVKLIPLRNSILTVNNPKVSTIYNQFRGIINVRRSSWSGNVWMVNELELEDYLKGLAEVPDSWPMEARNAQVIAARTFATRRMFEPKADIFDIYDDTRDQVYYGYNYELARPGIAQAVMATSGKIIKYGNEPILAYYFSDSGGATENVENVWGRGDPARAIPYLKGKSDPYAKPLLWDAAFTQRQIYELFVDQLVDAGAQSETVVDIVIDQRYPSGRLKTVSLVTSSGKRATMNALTFDAIMDGSYVKSLVFDVQKSGVSNAPDFNLSGRGWGHGVGLAQWSAYNMAKAGQTAEQILQYFYTGVNVGLV